MESRKVLLGVSVHIVLLCTVFLILLTGGSFGNYVRNGKSAKSDDIRQTRQVLTSADSVGSLQITNVW